MPCPRTSSDLGMWSLVINMPPKTWAWYPALKGLNVIELKCSNCNEEVEAPISLLGDTLDCPRCGQPIYVTSNTNTISNLITCPDCGKEISKHSLSCPNCGRPMQATTIEKTAKKYKAAMLIGGLMLIFSMTTYIIGWMRGGGEEQVTIISPISLVAGIVIYVYARIMAWWKHG